MICPVQNILYEINPYVHSFKTALKSIPQGKTDDYKLVISANKRLTAGHPGRYNTPAANEVAAVLVDQECERRDTVLRTRDDRV